ncbi:MAG: DNA-binding response regulator [Acidobacteria bacterium]|nr:MAG: DNA-binding response regulator [Acidobacteriota bacterium]
MPNFKILVVDDRAAFLDGLAMGLRHAGFDVTTAPGGMRLAVNGVDAVRAHERSCRCRSEPLQRPLFAGWRFLAFGIALVKTVELGRMCARLRVNRFLDGGESIPRGHITEALWTRAVRNFH